MPKILISGQEFSEILLLVSFFIDYYLTFLQDAIDPMITEVVENSIHFSEDQTVFDLFYNF